MGGGLCAYFASVGSKNVLSSSMIINSAVPVGYANLGWLGACTVFYPTIASGVLSSASRKSIKRSAVAMPLYLPSRWSLSRYSCLWQRLTAGRQGTCPQYAARVKAFGTNFAAPRCFLQMFTPWFGRRRLPPIGHRRACATLRSCPSASANLFSATSTRNNFNPKLLHTRGSAKWRNFAALQRWRSALFHRQCLCPSLCGQLQLLGGIWIYQTNPGGHCWASTTRLAPSLGAAADGRQALCRHGPWMRASMSKVRFSR